MKRIGIGLLVLLVASCQLLQKDKWSATHKAEKEEAQFLAQRSFGYQQQYGWFTDSSQHEFMLSVWPKGKFSFSLDSGFKGEAEKVELHGRQAKQTSKLLQHTRVQDSSAISASTSTQSERSSEVQKHKKSWGGSVWVILLLFLVSAYGVWRVLKSR